MSPEALAYAERAARVTENQVRTRARLKELAAAETALTMVAAYSMVRRIELRNGDTPRLQAERRRAMQVGS